MSTKRLLAALFILLLPGVAVACLWDYDTLAMERARFPSALELITGKFLRHSPEFYQWRVADRLAKLEKDPNNLALLDDLAVAHEKLGHHDKAIEIALKQDRIQPNRYETLANLGTFYIHAGQLEKGVEYIDRAIQINSDAHFGREKYQKLLVEYVLSKQRDGKLQLPLTITKRDGDRSPQSFLTYLKKRSDSSNGVPSADGRQSAIKGVLGMMKFGHYDSPVLLEALAGLLSYDLTGYDMPQDDAKRLAARAYLKASYEVKDGKAKEEYRRLAKEVLEMQRNGLGDWVAEAQTLEALEPHFQQELSEARGWYIALQQYEIAWIRDGRNPEEEFDKLYAADPEMSPSSEGNPMQTPVVRRFVIGWTAGGVAVVVVFIAAVVWIVRRRRRKAQVTA
ncbi:MAG: hypothetical protein ACJ8F7_21185 [Gemmataceae bacterium]